MTRIQPYLLVPNAKEVIETYKSIFDAEVVSHTPYTEEMGQQSGLPENYDYTSSTMHSEIKIGDARIYLADDISGNQNPSGRVDIMLEPDDEKQMKQFYDNAIKHGAEVIMEYQKTFWDAYFARFVDQFGIGWQMNYQVTPQDETA